MKARISPQIISKEPSKEPHLKNHSKEKRESESLGAIFSFSNPKSVNPNFIDSGAELANYVIKQMDLIWSSSKSMQLLTKS